MAFKAELPPDVSLPEGHRIDTSHQAYKALEAVATEERWSQKSFTRVLGIEARRVSAEAAARAAAPAAPPAPVKPDFSRMSFAEKALYALANPKRP
jgi:hypothetical protein